MKTPLLHTRVRVPRKSNREGKEERNKERITDFAVNVPGGLVRSRPEAAEWLAS